MDLVVVGAGPAGLTTALAAARRGFRVRLYDQGQPDSPAPGTWVINPNGLRVLRRAGTFSLQAVDRARLEDPAGRVLADLPLRSAVALRKTLLEELRGLCLEAGVEFFWGWRLLSRGRPLHFDQGVVQAPLVVAANGCDSTLRRAWRVGGRRYVRGLLSGPPPRPYPLEIWYPDGSRAGYDPTLDGRTGFYYTGTAPELRGVLESEEKTCGPAFSLPGQRGLFLIGDAAHAQAPTLSQGCNVALVDGWLLGHTLPRAAPPRAFLTRTQLLSWLLSEVATRPFPGRNRVVAWLARRRLLQRWLLFYLEGSTEP